MTNQFSATSPSTELAKFSLDRADEILSGSYDPRFVCNPSPDILLFIAKDDEFKFIAETQTEDIDDCDLPPHFTSPTGDHIEHYSAIPVGENGSKRASLTILHSRKAGELRACSKLMGVLASLDKPPKLLVNIGTSATMKSDVNFGDVVVADSIWRYAENTKVRDLESDDDALVFLHSPDDFIKPDQDLATWASMPTTSKGRGAWESKWKAKCDKIRRQHGLNADQAREGFHLHTGRIASGPFLLDSETLKKQLSKQDGNVLCLDMESGGCCAAVPEMPSERRPKRTWVIRGISDKGDGSKSRTDTGDTVGSNGESLKPNAYRAASMRSAYALFSCLLQSEVGNQIFGD